MQEDSYLILHAKTVSLSDFTLNGINIFQFNNPGYACGRESMLIPARIENGVWVVPDAHIMQVGAIGRKPQARFSVTTELTPDTIQNNFTSPNSLSFWSMPRYISNMESTGFSSNQGSACNTNPCWPSHFCSAGSSW